MNAEVMRKILLEVMKGVPAPDDEPAEHTEARRRLQAQCDEIRAMGGTVDIELP